MAQAEINNHTLLACETLFASDEVLRPIMSPVVKATFDILDDGKLKFSEEQIPVNLDGEYTGDPESSSYVYEPEVAFIKQNTDVVVVGDAVSTKGPVPHLLVEISVGKLKKQIGVIGDRCWNKQAVGYRMSEITPFEVMPITYENAFGGWDRRHEDARNHGFESRNTVGKGFYVEGIESEAPMMLPNIENPEQQIRSLSDRPAPVGCGFTLPHWQPRAKLAGTFDDAWQENTVGRLPKDFDRKFFNAASDGLISDGFLLGNEPVVVTNMHEKGRLAFYLPGVRNPVCELQTRSGKKSAALNLDTIIINTRTGKLQMIWRNLFSLTRGPHDVDAIDIRYG